MEAMNKKYSTFAAKNKRAKATHKKLTYTVNYSVLSAYTVRYSYESFVYRIFFSLLLLPRWI